MALIEPVVAHDVSGRAQPPLTSTGNVDSTIKWGAGPPVLTDQHQTLQLNPGDTAGALQGDYPVYDPGGHAPGPLTVDPASATTVDLLTGGSKVFAVSYWFSVNDIYGPTSGTPGDTDGPYVGLLRFAGADTDTLDVVWRPKDHRILIAVNVSGTGYLLPLSSTGHDAAPLQLNHLFLTVRCSQTSPYPVTVQGFLNGAELDPYTTDLAAVAPFVPAGYPLVGIGSGNQNQLPGGTGTDQSVYRLSGSVAHLALFGPPDVELVSTAGGVPATMVLTDYAFDLYNLAATGRPETAAARFDRLAAYLPGVTFTRTGTPLGALLGAQDTDGQTFLSVICRTLRAEEAHLEAATTAGVGKVFTRLHSLQRSTTPRFSVDVDADGAGMPVLSFDQSGAVSTVTVNGTSGGSVTFKVDPAVQDDTSSATIDSALRDEADMLALAQFRAGLGRPTVVIPSTVTVDASTSQTDLTAALLDDVRGGDTVRITGLPAAVVGYTEILCVIVGITETHSLTGSKFELNLQPLGAI